MPGPKRQITLRIDQDVVEYFRSQGPGYQRRMNAYCDAMCMHNVTAREVSRHYHQHRTLHNPIAECGDA